MPTQDIRETKKMGRPPGRRKPETALIRVQVETLSALDAWIAAQPEPRPSRPEAMRVIVADWMTSHGRM